MPIVATSPLDDLRVGDFTQINLGDGAAGYTWVIPPGSLLPPGMHLDKDKGILYGKPTIPGTYHFIVNEISNTTGAKNESRFALEIKTELGVKETDITRLIVEAFQVGKAFDGMEWWVSQTQDAQGRRVYGLKVNDNGQERSVASITVS